MAATVAPGRMDGMGSGPGMRRSIDGASSPAAMTLGIGLLGAIIFAVLTPPFQVPDEPQHFFRAYQLSEGGVFAEVRDGRAGGTLPAALVESAEAFLHSRALHTARPVTPHPLGQSLRELARPLDPGRREFIDFSGAAIYAPFAYAPQALAIGGGRLLGGGPLALLLAARLANGIAAALLLALAVRLMPGCATMAMGAALLPMAVFEYGSASPDALLIASVFLFTAVTLRSALEARWPAGRVVLAAGCGIVFCTLKPVYAPLLLIGAWAGLRAGPVRAAMLAQGAVLAVTLTATLAWLWLARPGLVLPVPGTDLAAQARWIVSDPQAFASVLVATVSDGAFLYFTAVGVLGWLSVTLPLPLYALPLPALVAGLLADSGRGPRLPLGAAAWGALMVGSSAVLVMTALYLYASPVGADRVAGVQGRYFLPLLAPVVAAVGALGRVEIPAAGRRAAGVAALLAAILMLAGAVTAVVGAYGVL